jgi:hypothetical protein
MAKMRHVKTERRAVRIAAVRHLRQKAWVVLAPIAAALVWRYRDGFGMPFLNDDYVFLDATAHRSFASLWGFQQLFFYWWRPWSREFHYWALQHVFGANDVAFHAANALLAMAVLAMFFNLARSLVGEARAAFAAIACAAMAAWALPMLWAAGAQDLWMMAWALAALLAWRHERTRLALAAFALALASKETAAPVPALFVAWDLWIMGRSLGSALRRAAPAAALTLVWAIVHPHLGGHLFRHIVVESGPPTSHVSPLLAVLRTVLSLASLETLPAPNEGWGHMFVEALPAALLLAGGLAWFARKRATSDSARASAALRFGLAWAVLGWLPLLWPSLGWHAYYGLFGAMGAWLAISSMIPWKPRVAVSLIALLAVLAAARDASYSRDWGDAFYQRRAGVMLSAVRAMLFAQAPTFAPHTRVYFAGVPNNIGFLQGNGPALRIWYRDTTLRAAYLSTYRRQPPGVPGQDRFFKLDPGPRLVELVLGKEDAGKALAADPLWIADHASLASSFIDAGDYGRARDEYIKLAEAQPTLAEPAYNVAACSQALGDTLTSARWMSEARRRPVVSDRLKATARASGLQYW